MVSVPHFDDCHNQHFIEGFIQPSLVFERESLVYAAVGDMQIINEHYIFIPVNVIYIHVVQSSVHHTALFTELHYGVISELYVLGFLEFQFRRLFFHLLHHLPGEFLAVTFENLPYFGNLQVILFP